MNKKTVLILGAKSGMAVAIAHQFAALGHPIQLAARNLEDLQPMKSDLEIRYEVPVTTHEFDALATETHATFIENLPSLPDIVICAVGVLGDQESSNKDTSLATNIIRANFEGPAIIFTLLANQFEQRGSGTLVGISSVSGLRGRTKQAYYGAAKSGFSTLLAGLRNRLAKKGVHVVTVLPGFVATRMTENLDLPARLTAQPEEVAAAIVKAVQKKKNVIYVRSIWRIIMLIIRSIPENIFKKMEI